MATIWRRTPGEILVDGGAPQRLHTRQLLGGEFGEQVERCSFCGGPEATAYWRGERGPISCCRTCAVETLPALMADAVVGEIAPHSRTVAQLGGALERFESRFWRAAVIALCRTARQQ